MIKKTVGLIFLFLLIIVNFSCKEFDKKKFDSIFSIPEKSIKSNLDHKNLSNSQYYSESQKWHFSKDVLSDISFWSLFLLEDSLITNMLRDSSYWKNDRALNGYKYGAKKILINQAIAETKISEEWKSDKQTLGKKFLRENTEMALKVRHLDWCKHLSDSDFCEYVLPYRFNTEPGYPIRRQLYEHFIKYSQIDLLKNDPLKAAREIEKRLKFFNWDWDENPPMPDLGFYNLFYWQNTSVANCDKHIAILGPVLRAIGIPVAQVTTPTWRDTDLGHSWCAIPDSTGKLNLFSAFYMNDGLDSLSHHPGRGTKLFMKTFAPQQNSPYFLKSNKEILPPFFSSPCLKDITKQVVKTRDVELELNLNCNGNNLIWFCIFIQGKWKPVGWGLIDKKSKRAIFKDLPCGLTGIACNYNKETLTPCSRLFTVSQNSIEYIIPENKKISLQLTCKFPEKTRLQYFTREIIGSEIQGANNPEFKDATSLGKINTFLPPYLQDIVFKNSGFYKYYRVICPAWHTYLAEIEFLTGQKTKYSEVATSLPVFTVSEKNQKVYYKLKGKIIGSTSPDSLAFDGNMLTYDVNKWIGMEFVQPQNVSRIRVAPRNANNGIVPGDTYQLLYWNNGWIEAGIQKAAYNFIEFRDVPSNTLYWLRNLDHGKEEQPFFYRDGKQVFSNQ